MELKYKEKIDSGVFDYLYKFGTIITIFLLIMIFGIVESSFLQPENIINILRSISIVTIIAVGVTVSLTVGGFDLSVGSVASVADAVVLSMFVWYNQVTWVSILVALGVGLIMGAINALLIVKVRIPDMLLTLATMFIFQGVAQTYTRGATVSKNMIMPDGNFAQGNVTELFKKLGQVPWIIIIMVAIVITVHVFLTKTKHGRYMYVIGGNQEAARLSGIPVKKYKVYAYLISAFFASVGGIILASRVQTAEINAGSAYLMDAVAAAYIGFSVGGSGKPNVLGTFVGAILIGILQNGLVMMSVPYYSMDIVKGLVLAFALALTYWRKK
ncbi:simple sugar transport system permease protein [Trichococcus flocculiformis]|uniref:ABC transporter permease n=1 Tax=Trichococcus TaxID=82802 RepID=UPI0007A8E497|nr:MULTISPECIES: ABC transporter permease [Trichococcus]CZQ85926.1 abc transporter permease [Trichococcus sp. ES5]SHG11032.1 simple sugar transport system permease protein [Trichococcus flocculiformis]